MVYALEELWLRRIIREQGVNAYDFSHDKLRDVAYSEISPMQQRRLHRRVAQALEEIHAADLDPVSAQIAAQYERAGVLLPAVGYYQRAGAGAQRVYANVEAISLYYKGCALLGCAAQSPRTCGTRIGAAGCPGSPFGYQRRLWFARPDGCLPPRPQPGN